MHGNTKTGHDSLKVVKLIEEHYHDLLVKDQTFTLRPLPHVKECWQSITNLIEALKIRLTQAYEYKVEVRNNLKFHPQDHYNNISAKH